MSANKIIRVGPVSLAGSVSDILSPPTLTGGVGVSSTNTYIIIRHIRIVNRTAGVGSFSLYIGASGASVAGTEFEGNSLNVAANSAYDYYGLLRLDVGNYLTGMANAGSTLTMTAEGEVGVA